jgi:predicted nucleic acid-binding protein
MNLCVIDCSFFVGWILPDEEKIEFDPLSVSVHVPSIFFLELLSAFKKSLKRQRITKQEHDEFLEYCESLPFTVDHFSSTQESLSAIAKLSEEYDLTSYDASYLELALRLKAPLGTFDRKIIDACQVRQIKLLALSRATPPSVRVSS